jgi:mono/diheme cytochrome c family protein
LYNINGQIAFAQNGAIANFPKGDYNTKQVGAVEIKFAWKILTASDYKDRYYHTQGYVLDEKTNKFVKKDLGMIGFHISQKTPTGSQWVWSTFEHIDNLDQNPTVGKDGKTTFIHPTLTDPDCEICPVNVDVSGGGNSFTFKNGPHGDYWAVNSSGTLSAYYANSNVMKTQAKRMIDIPLRVKQVNQMMQTYFKSQNSVWQYYQLIDTQYPLDQNVPPAPHDEDNYNVPKSVLNKPGGKPNVALLTNISMETFFQLGNQSASQLMENNPATAIQIFGTESCMGCHSSAGIAKGYVPLNDSIVYGPQLSGDFSWLLQTKANWDTALPKPGKK